MRRTALGIGVFIVSALACSPGSTKSSSGSASSTLATDRSQAAQREGLMQTSRNWAKAAASGDVDRIVSYWADDAIVLEPGQLAIFGKPAIRKWVEASMKVPKFSITWGPESGALSTDGTMGYLIEHSRLTFADSTGKVQTRFGKAVTVWRKDSSGAWKCVIDTWNASPSENVYPAE